MRRGEEGNTGANCPIGVFKPSMNVREKVAVSEVIESGWIGLGPKTAEFEKRFADFVGAKFAVGVNSGTAALHLALELFEIGPGDEVIVPAITFASTALAVEYCGATPVVADVDPLTMCIDVRSIERAITKKTAAIIPVHYAGQPCDMRAIASEAAWHRLFVIEDAAHACGSGYKGEWDRGYRVGSGIYADATCFSFHAVKNLATGDGGMITVNVKDFAKKLKQLRWCGISKDTWARTEDVKSGAKYGWNYEVVRKGYKCHMNDIQAAIGLVQLQKLKDANYRRQWICSQYDRAFATCGTVVPLFQHRDRESSRHLYAVLATDRDYLHDRLAECGISTGVHYKPLPLHPHFKDIRGECPVAMAAWKKLLTLPVYPDMTDEQVEYVIGCVLKYGT
jgi:perosamine synthetase